jgi:hypothetical protein
MGAVLMPRTEARIFTSIWKDADFLALPPTAQRLYMFLLSQPELTYCGTMPLRERRWVSKAAGLTLDDIERDLKELEGNPHPSENPGLRQPFVITDGETGELLVRALMRRDTAWKQPNLLKLAVESAAEIESLKIRRCLLGEVQRLPLDDTPSEQVRTLVGQLIQDLGEGSPDPSAYPPDNSEPNGSADGTDDSSDEARPRARLLQPPISGLQTHMSAQPPRDRRQGTRMPDPFPVDAEMVAWVHEKCPHVDGKRETERFEDHWRGKAGKEGRKLDWVATWRNWMRTAEDRQGPRDRSSKAMRGGAAEDLSGEVYGQGRTRI